VEHALRAAVRAGVPEADFWRLTPFRLNLILSEKGRADAVQGLWTGWMVARLAPEREQSLSGPGHYYRQFFEAGASEADAEALADAEFNRIARTFGIEIVDLGDEEVSG